MPAMDRPSLVTGRFVAHRRRGQALIEMAIVSMLLVVLVGGIVDFGVYMYKDVQAANCVREAARRAAVRDPNAASPGYCVDASLKPTLTADYMTLPAGAEVTATISSTHSWLAISYLIPGMGSTIQLKASTTMRMEGKKI